MRGSVNMTGCEAHMDFDEPLFPPFYELTPYNQVTVLENKKNTIQNPKMFSFYEERRLQREWEKKEKARLIDEYMQKLRAKRLEKEEQVRIQELRRQQEYEREFQRQELRRQQEYEREFQRQEVVRGLQEILGMMKRFQEKNAISAEQRQKESDQFVEDVRITSQKAREKRDAQIKQAKEKRDAQTKLNVVQLDMKNVVHEIFDDDVCDDDSSIHSNDALPKMETGHIDNSLMPREIVIDVIEPSLEEFVKSPCVIVDIVAATEKVDIVIKEVEEIKGVTEDSYMSEIDNPSDLLPQRKELQSCHVYFDPFLVHYHPFNFVVVDLYAVPHHTYERMTPTMFTCLHFVVGTSGMVILTYDRPRLVFDPGRFEDESF